LQSLDVVAGKPALNLTRAEWSREWSHAREGSMRTVTIARHAELSV